MTTPSGTISLNDIQTEFSGANPIAINEYYGGAGYLPTGIGVPSSGQISFDDLRGKSNVINLTTPEDTTLYNVNLRQALIDAGWNQTVPATYTISSTTKIFSTSVGSAALTVSGSFPNGLKIINNGKIYGKGGQGGYNFGGFGQGGGPGEAGGVAILVSTNCTIENIGTIGGGGGGGGCAGSPSNQASYFVTSGGGGGGAGGDGGAAGTSYYYTAPEAGGEETGGAGGVGYASVTGGKGGDLGCDGNGGPQGANGGGGGGAGGRSGRAVLGNEFVTWIAYGTIKGGIRESTWASIGGFFPDKSIATELAVQRNTTSDAIWGPWGPFAYGSNSLYMYSWIYQSSDVWGHYPAAQYADNDYYGPLSLLTANSQTFDWKLFGKNIRMNSAYSDTGLFVSTNSYVGVTQSVYDISKASEWSVEGWFYPTEEGVSGSSHMTLINLNCNNIYYGLHIWRANGGALVVDDGVTGRAAFTGGNNKKIPLGQWSHVLIERSGSDVYGYIDGVYVGRHTNMNAYPNLINSYKIGCLAQYATYHFCGYIASVRICKVAKYNTGTSDFTPRTIPFNAVSPSDTNTVLLACTTSDPTYDASNYRLTGRATGSGLTASTPGYSRDNQLVGSDAPVATTAQYPFSGSGYSVFFKGPGTVGTPWDTVGSDYRGYGILEFPGKIPNPDRMTRSSSFSPSFPAIDKIMVCAQDLKSGHQTMEAGCAPYYESTADYTRISYAGASSTATPWPTTRVQWQMHFYNPSLFGGRMAVGIHTAPLGSTAPAVFGTALTAWVGAGVSMIASADGTEYLDFSDKLNGPGQSVLLIGDTEGRNWKVYSGFMRWSDSTNKSFSTDPANLNYNKF